VIGAIEVMPAKRRDARRKGRWVAATDFSNACAWLNGNDDPDGLDERARNARVRDGPSRSAASSLRFLPRCSSSARAAEHVARREA